MPATKHFLVSASYGSWDLAALKDLAHIAGICDMTDFSITAENILLEIVEKELGEKFADFLTACKYPIEDFDTFKFLRWIENHRKDIRKTLNLTWE